MRYFHLIVICLILTMISACGQSGTLYLPEQPTKQQPPVNLDAQPLKS